MEIPTEQLPSLAPFSRKKPTPSQTASLLASQHRPPHGDGDDDSPLPTLVRYRDVVKAGICSNRMQLARMITNEGMPAGFKLSANVHVWNVSEVLAWLQAKQRQDQAK